MEFVKAFAVKNNYDGHIIVNYIENSLGYEAKREYDSNKPTYILVRDINYTRTLDKVTSQLIRRKPEDEVKWVDVNGESHMYYDLVLGKIKFDKEQYSKVGFDYISSLFNKKYKLEKSPSNILITTQICDVDCLDLDYLFSVGKRIREHNITSIHADELMKLGSYLDENYDELSPYIHGYLPASRTGKILIK